MFLLKGERTMKRHVARIFCFLLLAALATKANAQASDPQAHVAAAKAAAYEPGHDLSDLYGMCAEKGPGAPAAPREAAAGPVTPKPLPRNQWYMEPVKVFDNLYYIGPTRATDNTIWAITTSEGIILIDAGWYYQAEDLVMNGLKQLNLDPQKIKYVLVTTSKAQNFSGARYLQDHTKARIGFSDADWTTIEKANFSDDIKPKRDMVITDGQKVTLGDVTVTLYVTPGNSPGTLSMVIGPLKDGNQKHMASHPAGKTFVVAQDGVQYFPNEMEAMTTWTDQVKRFRGIVQKANADVLLSPRVSIDKTTDKLNAIQFRKPGGPHPFVSKTEAVRAQTVLYECMEAQLVYRAEKTTSNLAPAKAVN
jgi:metallo-beta-lactamase class B